MSYEKILLLYDYDYKVNSMIKEVLRKILFKLLWCDANAALISPEKVLTLVWDPNKSSIRLKSDYLHKAVSILL